jgi:dienelactone hydrolase
LALICACTVLVGGVQGIAAAGASDSSRVAIRTETLVDSTRVTPAHPAGTDPAHAERTLITTIYYPADADGSPSDGPFPIVVFSHGTASDPSVHDRLLREWARAGHVVVAPEYPRSARDAPGGPDPTNQDRDEQPADASFVLDEVLRLPWLRSSLDPTRIAAAGHSLGGYTTLQLAYGACCRDARVDAAIVLAGLGYGVGGVAVDASPPPLLLVHASDDRSVPARLSEQAFCEARGRRWLVTLDVPLAMSAHTAPFRGGTSPWAEVTTRTSLDVLALTLGEDDSAGRRLARDARRGDAATLSTAAAGDPCPDQDRHGDEPR